MRATIPFVEERFARFNALCFGGTLPPIRVELSNAKTFLGQCVWKRRRKLFGRTEHYDFRLRVNSRVDLSEEVLEDTIIHEMIHYHIALNRIKDTSAHGQVFRQMMQEINTRHGRHITISHRSRTPEEREQFYDSRPRWHAVALVRFSDGRLGLKVLPRVAERIRHYRAAVSRHPDVSGVTLYLHNDPWLNRFPSSAALRIHPITWQEAQEHLTEAKPLEI